VIKSGDLKTLTGKGLPFHKQSFKYGNMFVSFKVTFPTKLDAKQLEFATKALGHMPKADTDMNCKETCQLQTYSEK